MSVFIIAEAGINHNGDEAMAFKLIDVAVNTGADAVKFQTFKASDLVGKHNVDRYNQLKNLELSYEFHHKLFKYCQARKIVFLSTAFAIEGVDFLVNNLKLKTLKVSSGDLNNAPLLLAFAEKKCQLIVSTGLATLAEIEEALGIIAFGLIDGENPSADAFKSAYYSVAGQQSLKNKVTLLHCTTEYPAPLKDINLNAITTLQQAFNLRTGYSDHSEGIVVPIVAASLGAIVIEKHITLDQSLPGPDQSMSIEPDELKLMVEGIRATELIMGDGLKLPQASEIPYLSIARRSLVANKAIKKGELFTPENLTTKRPANGLSPNQYWSLLNTISSKDYAEGDMIVMYSNS
jgi:sialic acid synthase SpsE